MDKIPYCLLGNNQYVRFINLQASSLSLNNVVILAEKYNTLYMEKYNGYGLRVIRQKQHYRMLA